MQSSWVPGANSPSGDFPLANLPYGVFSRGGDTPRCGVAIGDHVVDLAALAASGLLGEAARGWGLDEPGINSFMAAGPEAWAALRARLTDLLAEDGSADLRDNAELRARALVPMNGVSMHLPFRVTGYTISTPAASTPSIPARSCAAPRTR